MSEIQLDSLYSAVAPLLNKSHGEPAIPNGLPVQGQVDSHESQRGPDTIVEFSPQATEAAAQESDSNESTDQENAQANDHEKSKVAPRGGTPQSPSEKPLSEEEQKQVEDLKARDQEVRSHEQAHIASAGSLAQGGPTYTYQTGPDGNQYAVGGEVNIDSSPVKGDPAATIRKMEQVQRAAQAPASPSSQDQAVAAQAAQAAQEARQELNKQKAQESGLGVGGKSSNAHVHQEEGSSIDPATEETPPPQTVSSKPNQALDGMASSRVEGGFKSSLSQPRARLDIRA